MQLLAPALAHGVCGLLTGLPAYDTALREQADLAKALRLQFAHASLVDHLYAQALERIAKAFDEAGVRALLIKGTALARTHYLEPGHRARVDADIFVAQSQRAVAELCLTRLGMLAPPSNYGDLVLPERSFELASGRDIVLCFDLHWGLSSRPLLAQALAFNDLFARAVPVPGLQGWLAPDAVHAVLLAAVHRIGHHRDQERWIWLYDVHLLWNQFSSQQRHQAVFEAQSRGISSLLLDALRACILVLDTAVHDYELEALAAAAAGEPSAQLLDAKRSLLWFDLRHCGWRERVQLLQEHALPPHEFMVSRFGEHATWLRPAWHVRRWYAGLKSN